MPAPQVYILRGLPGSGKSTLARHIKKRLPGQTVIISDDHHIMPAGHFRFDRTELEQARQLCWQRYLQLLYDDHYSVIVDNVNSQLWQYRKYYDLAMASYRTVTILELPCLDREALDHFHQRNGQQVPFSLMRSMYYQWQNDERAIIVINPFSFIKKMTA